MKNLGITRRIDELGRVVIPIEVRRSLSLAEKDAVDFYLDEKEQTLILKKCAPSCFCCQSTEGLKVLANGACICENCLSQAR